MSTKGILHICSIRSEKTNWARRAVVHFFTTITTENTLIKWKSDFRTYTTRHVGKRHLQHSKQWMLTLYAQASNTFNTSKTYQKLSGDVILGISCRYCSVYKLQDRMEYGLIETSLISSASYLSFGWGRNFVWGLSGDGTEFRAPVRACSPIGVMESGWYGSAMTEDIFPTILFILPTCFIISTPWCILLLYCIYVLVSDTRSISH